MKNLEMNAGIQEMSMTEMESVNGGFWCGVFVFLAATVQVKCTKSNLKK